MTDSKVLIEAVGYLGSALVLVAFLMTSVVKLRVVNSIGSLIFATYAVIIHSYPTALMNVCLILINVYYLWKLKRPDRDYSLAVLAPTDGYVRYFLSHYEKDISRCFPDRIPDLEGINRAYLVCHGSEPSGLLLGKEADGVLTITLDYSTPAFRDSSEGRFLLERLPDEGLHTLRYENAEEGHISYLKRMGYSLQNGVWERTL